MAENARQMQEASSQIAQKMADWVEEIHSGSEGRAQSFENIEKQGELMARQMEALTTSLARMQAKVDQLCEEIDRAQE
jgi:hypothetical protein